MENKRLKSLTSASDFSQLRKKGRYLYPSNWLLVSHRKNDSGMTRVAWSISRKCGGAVIRNRMKRWGREYMRVRAQGLIHGYDFNFIFKPQSREFFKDLDHESFDQALKKVMARIE